MPPVFYIAIFRAYMDCFRHEGAIPNNRETQVVVADKYAFAVEDDVYDRFARLDGDPAGVDTGLEAVLTLYDSVAVQAIRPARAEEVLPHNRASEIKLAGAIFQHLQAIKFLDPQNRNRIGNYETELKFRTDKNKITQAELNAALRASISTVVDEEFNKISFYFNNRSIKKDYNAVLARDPQNGQYILSYGGVYTNGETRTVKGNTLDALEVEMRKNKTDFDETGIKSVRAQAALIPAVAKPAELTAVKQVITNFYTTPNDSSFQAIKNLRASFLSEKTTRADAIFRDAIYALLWGFNQNLAQKL